MSNADWRNEEPDLKEVIRNHPDVSPLIILKTDVQRRGIEYTDAALKKCDPAIHQTQYSECTRTQADKGVTPSSLIMRDGTSILTGFKGKNSKRDAYTIDVVDDRIVIVDQDEVLEEVFYWEKPHYYDKFTKSGKPMWEIVSARPQRVDIYPHHYCEFWNIPGGGCKYCAAAAISKSMDERENLHTTEEIVETVREALKQEGRFVNVFFTAGSTLSGAEVFDDEVDRYIEILQAVGELFETPRFPSQLVGTAYNEKQLRRLYENTGIMSYSADIEVLNEEKFNWICPGKASVVGYREWKERLYRAADLFGRGYVNTSVVAGTELAVPNGFLTEEEALARTLEEADELGMHGISVVESVWTVSEGSIFFNQQTPSLEYYISLAKGFDDIRTKYGMNIDMDNYRRCGNHPDTDMSRISRL